MDKLEIIRKPIERNLLDFSNLFDTTLTDSDNHMSKIFSLYRINKGKLMRPILVLLSAKEFGEINDRTHKAALSLELLHNASLVHDDVIDESNQRRGKPSLNALYGNQVAVLAGDYMLSSAMLMLANTNNLDMVATIADLGKQLSRGEILQQKRASETPFSEDSYYEVIRLKTATLFATCAKLGALSSGASYEQAQMMYTLGEYIGMCFQIRDDIFDYFQDTTIGKPTGNDLAEGKITLPLIYALSNFGTEKHLQLAEKVKNLTISKQEISTLVEFAINNGGIGYAQEIMQKFSQKANTIISQLSNEEIKISLSEYVQFVTQRSH